MKKNYPSICNPENVEQALKSNHYALTCLRAGIIVGFGSASFEIIRDLVEKLPIMVAPKWLKTKCLTNCHSKRNSIFDKSLGRRKNLPSKL